MAKTMRTIVTPGAKCVPQDATLDMAAQQMRDLEVGSLPICGNHNKLKGMMTDRDITIKCVAEGIAPSTVRAGSLSEGKPVTIGADDTVNEATEVMQWHKVRRLPVIEGHTLASMLSQADIARNFPPERVGGCGRIYFAIAPSRGISLAAGRLQCLKLSGAVVARWGTHKL